MFVTVYRARTLADAHIVAASLRAAGIDVEIRGEELPRLAGAIPIPDAMARVCVSESQKTMAELVLAELDKPVPEWTCTGCGEVNPGTFEVCWKCGVGGPVGPTPGPQGASNP